MASDAFATGPGCSCDRDEILDQIRTAETIFYGRIVEAQMESAASEHIQLTVELTDPIRGLRTGSISIATTLPHNCGIPAEIGEQSLFVVPDIDKPVTRCSGSSLPYDFEGSYELVCALITISYVNDDPSIVKDWLKKRICRGSSTREDMQDYFDVLEELDPSTIMIYTDNEVIYRNLVFVFKDDRLESYFWR